MTATVAELVDRILETGVDLAPSQTGIRWSFDGPTLPPVAETLLGEVAQRKSDVVAELLSRVVADGVWDDDFERARMDATYDWCDANWWAGAWDWCKDNRPDLYAEMDSALLLIDQAWKRYSVKEHTAACNALRSAVLAICEDGRLEKNG